MSIATIAAIAYGILALVGGIVGYTKAKSQMSLISGVISGILLILGGVMGMLGAAWGVTLAAIVAALLVVVFVVRWIKTKKFMPAGLMVLAGVLTVILVVT